METVVALSALLYFRAASAKKSAAVQRGGMTWSREGHGTNNFIFSTTDEDVLVGESVVQRVRDGCQVHGVHWTTPISRTIGMNDKTVLSDDLSTVKLKHSGGSFKNISSGPLIDCKLARRLRQRPSGIKLPSIISDVENVRTFEANAWAFYMGKMVPMLKFWGYIVLSTNRQYFESSWNARSMVLKIGLPHMTVEGIRLWNGCECKIHDKLEVPCRYIERLNWHPHSIVIVNSWDNMRPIEPFLSTAASIIFAGPSHDRITQQLRVFPTPYGVDMHTDSVDYYDSIRDENDWHQKRKFAIWRGAASGIHCDGDTVLGTRFDMMQVAQENTDLIDFAFTKFDWPYQNVQLPSDAAAVGATVGASAGVFASFLTQQRGKATARAIVRAAIGAVSGGAASMVAMKSAMAAAEQEIGGVNQTDVKARKALLEKSGVQVDAAAVIPLKTQTAHHQITLHIDGWGWPGSMQWAIHSNTVVIALSRFRDGYQHYLLEPSMWDDASGKPSNVETSTHFWTSDASQVPLIVDWVKNNQNAAYDMVQRLNKRRDRIFASGSTGLFAAMTSLATSPVMQHNLYDRLVQSPYDHLEVRFKTVETLRRHSGWRGQKNACKRSYKILCTDDQGQKWLFDLRYWHADSVNEQLRAVYEQISPELKEFVPELHDFEVAATDYVLQGARYIENATPITTVREDVDKQIVLGQLEAIEKLLPLQHCDFHGGTVVLDSDAHVWITEWEHAISDEQCDIDQPEQIRMWKQTWSDSRRDGSILQTLDHS